MQTVAILGLNKELDAVQVSVNGVVVNVPRASSGKFPSTEEIIRQAKSSLSSPITIGEENNGKEITCNPPQATGTHGHRCHICEGIFTCSRENCGIEDKYAVCQKVACMAEWEAPERNEWDEDPVFDACELTHDCQEEAG